MSLDELSEVGLPCPGPTGLTAPASPASTALPGLPFNLTSLGCNTTVATTKSAAVNFTWQDLTVVAVSCIVIAVIVIGNTLVIVAVMTTRRLRTITNCFVMSLAVADWLVGVFVLPPAVAYQLMGTWELGWVLCDLWVSLDVLLCTASILSLCAISVDRYLAVTQPLNYSRRRRSKRLALAMILVVWVAAAVITCPPIFGWYEKGRHANRTCRYNQNVGYVLFSAMGSFFVPLAVMLYVYARIHCVVARRHDSLTAWDSRQTTRKLRDVSLDVRSPVPCSYSSGSGVAAGDVDSPSLAALGPLGPLVPRSAGVPGVARRCQTCYRSSCAASLNGNLAVQSTRSMVGSGSLGALSSSCVPTSPPDGESSVDLNHHHHHHHHHQQQQHQPHPQQHKRQHQSIYSGVCAGGAGGARVSSFRRADSKTTKTLWMLVGGFVACWLPFFVVYIVTPFLPSDAVSKQLSSGLTWLGWINSAANPFIYAFYSPDFRVAFWRLTLRHCTPRSKAGPLDSSRK